MQYNTFFEGLKAIWHNPSFYKFLNAMICTASECQTLLCRILWCSLYMVVLDTCWYLSLGLSPLGILFPSGTPYHRRSPKVYV